MHKSDHGTYQGVPGNDSGSGPVICSGGNGEAGFSVIGEHGDLVVKRGDNRPGKPDELSSIQDH